MKWWERAGECHFLFFTYFATCIQSDSGYSACNFILFCGNSDTYVFLKFFFFLIFFKIAT